MKNPHFYFQKVNYVPIIPFFSFQLMNIGKKVLGETLFAKIMKMTFYGHFVAGENRAAIKPVIHRMHSFGVKSILDYSVEEDLSESQAKKIEME